ncbi:peptidase inhibitor family I36 protein [Actinosynnema sp. NPDC020468]|uniref:peptidase inhibitor family I36 protein n=1 Tax=Actinosynnema sp. NPDC020468 TaxID=3154488 RepID=UPI0033FC01F3
MTTLGRKIAHAAVALGATAALALATTTTASAATARNGVCETGEFCLYYLSGLEGSVSDFTTSVPDYGTSQPGCYEFKGAGYGQGLCVKNNARSAWNRRAGAARVYYNSYYGGGDDVVNGYDYRDLAITYDENASHAVG